METICSSHFPLYRDLPLYEVHQIRRAATGEPTTWSRGGLVNGGGVTLEAWQLITKPPLLQESRLTGGGSPNLVDLVERKVPVERRMGATNSFHSFYP